MRTFVVLVVELEVHALAEEAQQIAHRLGAVLWAWVAPDEVLLEPLADATCQYDADPLYAQRERFALGASSSGRTSCGGM